MRLPHPWIQPTGVWTVPFYVKDLRIFQFGTLGGPGTNPLWIPRTTCVNKIPEGSEDNIQINK